MIGTSTQSEGLTTIIWHDGEARQEHFTSSAEADSFYDSIDDKFAKQMRRDGVEIKRYIKDDTDWPAEWTPLEGERQR